MFDSLESILLEMLLWGITEVMRVFLEWALAFVGAKCKKYYVGPSYPSIERL